VSEGHPYSSIRKSTDDIGGEFYTIKQYVSQKRKHLVDDITLKYKLFGSIPVTRSYSGLVVPEYPRTNKGLIIFPATIESSRTKLEQLGTTAISRCNPGNPASQAATFLGETVKDGFPSIPVLRSWERKTKAAQALGHEYLNLAFGWLPMVRDIDSMTQTLRHANSVLAQYERDAGKQVRRTYRFPTERSVDTTSYDNAYPAFVNGGLIHSGGKLTIVVDKTIERWFSGAFTYHLPSGYDTRNAMDRAALVSKLLGLEITPDTVWNLLPWSWAADWVSNAGDVVNNISRFANLGLIMRYGYMMEHTIVSHTYKLEGASLYKEGNPGQLVKGDPLHTNSITFVTETKRRIRANPYGFGLSWDGLSAFQVSVLSALGISRR
jgi:hypothetical protein